MKPPLSTSAVSDKRRGGIRRDDSIPLYPSEARIVAELYGFDASEKMAAAWDGVAAILERDGLPHRDPLFGNRRYWPAVVAYLERRNSLSTSTIGSAPDGEENWT